MESHLWRPHKFIESQLIATGVFEFTVGDNSMGLITGLSIVVFQSASTAVAADIQINGVIIAAVEAEGAPINLLEGSIPVVGEYPLYPGDTVRAECTGDSADSAHIAMWGRVTSWTHGAPNVGVW